MSTISSALSDGFFLKPREVRGVQIDYPSDRIGKCFIAMTNQTHRQRHISYSLSPDKKSLDVVLVANEEWATATVPVSYAEYVNREERIQTFYIKYKNPSSYAIDLDQGERPATDVFGVDFSSQLPVETDSQIIKAKLNRLELKKGMRTIPL
jgi:hypothetical protein